MKRKITAVLSVLALVHADASAQEGIEMRVTTTVPPRLCAYPQRCEPAMPGETGSRASVSADGVLYVGSPPEVEQVGDLLIVRF